MLMIPYLAACAPGPADPPGVGPDQETAEPSTDTGEAPRSPFALQGEYVHYAQPEDPELAALVSASAFAPPGGVLTLYVRDGASPLEGLAPHGFTHGDGYWWDLKPVEPGLYDLPDLYRFLLGYHPVTDLDVVAHAEPIDGWEPAVHLPLPALPLLTVPRHHPVGAPLVLAFEDQGYTTSLAVVIDPSGAVVWSTAAASFEALAVVNAEDAPRVEVPAEVWAAPGTWALGVAAMVRAWPLDFVDADVERSGFRAGSLQYWSISVEE